MVRNDNLETGLNNLIARKHSVYDAMLSANLVQVIVNLQDHPRHVSAITAPMIKLTDWNQHAVVLHKWNKLVSCCCGGGVDLCLSLLDLG